MRKYILLLMFMTVIGGGLTVFMLLQSSMAVLINNNTDEDITNLTLTYEGIKSDIEVPTIKSGEFTVIEIDPEEQADDSFDEASLELQYIDDTGKNNSETVFGYFEMGYSGDAEVTITNKDNNGVYTIEVDEDIGIGGLGK